MIRYLDASAVVAFFVKQDASALIDSEIRRHRDKPIVTDFTLAESSAALAKLGRVDRWSEPLRDFVFMELDAWASSMARHVKISEEDIADATQLVRSVGLALRAPDAIHIAAARRLDVTLLTLDHGMAKAAVALGVSCINPAEAAADRKT